MKFMQNKQLLRLVSEKKWDNASKLLKESSDKKALVTAKESGYIALHLAIMHKAPESLVLDLIDAYEETVLMKTKDMWTPLHFATIIGAPYNVVERLVEMNPDALDEKNKEGFTPRDYCSSEVLDDMSTVLVSKPTTVIKDEIEKKTQQMEEKLRALEARREVERIVEEAQKEEAQKEEAEKKAALKEMARREAEKELLDNGKSKDSNGSVSVVDEEFSSLKSEIAEISATIEALTKSKEDTDAKYAKSAERVEKLERELALRELQIAHLQRMNSSSESKYDFTGRRASESSYLQRMNSTSESKYDFPGRRVSESSYTRLGKGSGSRIAQEMEEAVAMRMQDMERRVANNGAEYSFLKRRVEELEHLILRRGL